LLKNKEKETKNNERTNKMWETDRLNKENRNNLIEKTEPVEYDTKILEGDC